MCSVSDYYIEPKSTPLLEGLATVPKLTTTLNLNNQNVTNGGTITATNFEGLIKGKMQVI